jgi:hypothetical protein
MKIGLIEVGKEDVKYKMFCFNQHGSCICVHVRERDHVVLFCTYY